MSAEPDTLDRQDAQWLRDCEQALSELDVDWFLDHAREFGSGFNRDIPDGAAGMHTLADLHLMALHQARYEFLTISDDLRRESENWLRARGIGRLDGRAWPGATN